MLKKFQLLIALSLLLSGCHFKSSTELTGKNLITPYGTADSINVQRNFEVGSAN